MIGDERQGDNLYSDSVVALDPKTGRLKWHFQFTPHDVHDYDAQQPLVLVDATWKGSRASSCCRPIATATSTSWTGPPASSCSGRRT